MPTYNSPVKYNSQMTYDGGVPVAAAGVVIDFAENEEQSIKQHDLGCKILDTLKYRDEPINLEDCTVSFLMKNLDTGEAIKKDADIEDEGEGRVSYEFEDGETDVAGRYIVEWEIEQLSGHTFTIPNDSYRFLTILRDLG